MNAAVAVTDLRKAFDGQVVLDGVDLQIRAGSIYALLGPNGAGKTTIVHILATLLAADAGHVLVAGYDVARQPEAVRSAIGVTGQFSAVDDLLTGRENLALMADLLHLVRPTRSERVDALLTQFELVDAADRPASTYSGGMRRRLDLAMTLMGTPSIIFLDEPTTGLDPNSRRTMWQIITDLARDGTTILLTTQYLDEADKLADRIAVLDRGRIVAEGTPAELKARIPGRHIQLGFATASALRTAEALLGDSTSDIARLQLNAPGDDTVATLRNLLNRLDAAAIDVDSVSIHTPDLDDVFFALTGHATEPIHSSESSEEFTFS